MFLTELLELCLIHRNVQLQDLRVRMELFSIHRVPGIHCGGMVCSDLPDLRQHGPAGLTALLLIFCTAFVRMDPRDGFALLLFPKVLFGCINLTNFGNIVFHSLIKSVFIIHELLIPYNPAAKAKPPKVGKTKPDYYEPELVADILDAAEGEPSKWRTILHLFLITGRRREDVCGLKWEKIDFESGIVCIDTALLYLPKLGIYESTTKTEDAAYIHLPPETLQLLREYRAWYNELKLKKGMKKADRFRPAIKF